jgi:hypothetical protein
VLRAIATDSGITLVFHLGVTSVWQVIHQLRLSSHPDRHSVRARLSDFEQIKVSRTRRINEGNVGIARSRNPTLLPHFSAISEYIGTAAARSSGHLPSQAVVVGNPSGAVSHKQLDYYLDEFTFRFNPRRSKSRGSSSIDLLSRPWPSVPCPWSRFSTRMLGNGETTTYSAYLGQADTYLLSISANP